MRLMLKSMKTSFTIIALLSCLIITSGARGQYHWHIVHQDHSLKKGTTKSYLQYSFAMVDCAGENCTAVGTVTDSSRGFSNDRNTIMIFRSVDGGLSWTEQN